MCLAAHPGYRDQTRQPNSLSVTKNITKINGVQHPPDARPAARRPSQRQLALSRGAWERDTQSTRARCADRGNEMRGAWEREPQRSRPLTAAT